MKSKKKRSICPVNFGVELFGDKWTLLIVRDMLIFKKHTFKEFTESDEKISTNILTDRLNLLEDEGVITKEEDPTHGSRFIYTLTPKGKELGPILVEMILWSAKHEPNSPVPKEYIQKLRTAREKQFE